MTHVVSSPTPPFYSKNKSLRVHQIPSWKDNLIWLIECVKTGHTYAVDGPEAGQVLAYCEKNGLSLKGVLNTHTHPDHVGINRALLKDFNGGALVIYGPKKARQDVPGITHAVCEGDRVEIGSCVGRVVLTEGHLNGHISYVFDDLIFCGDTMFAGGCGYLFDGPPEAMYQSLHRLAELGPHMKVCCAHEYTQDNLRFAWSLEPNNPALARRIQSVWAARAKGEATVPSTIESELDTNPFLRQRSNELVKNLKAAWPKRILDDEHAIFTATRELKNRKDYAAIQDSDLPLA